MKASYMLLKHAIQMTNDKTSTTNITHGMYNIHETNINKMLSYRRETALQGAL